MTTNYLFVYDSTYNTTAGCGFPTGTNYSREDDRTHDCYTQLASCQAAGEYWYSSSNYCSDTLPTTQTSCTAEGFYWDSFSSACYTQTCSNSTYYQFDEGTHSCRCRNGTSSFDCGVDQLWYPATCQCQAKGGSPVLVDVSGDGFSLTDAEGGVNFDLEGMGVPRRWAWTTPGSDDAWLALDRNNNGVIDSGAELFGNFTPQPDPPPGRDGNDFLAFAEFDKAEQGGNGNG